jgi:transposase
VFFHATKKILYGMVKTKSIVTNLWVRKPANGLLETFDNLHGSNTRISDWTPVESTHMVKNRIPDYQVATCTQFYHLPYKHNNKMKTSKKTKSNRTIGFDMHPDVFSAAALIGTDPSDAKIEWVKDRMDTKDMERWAKDNLYKTDTIVLEASGNSFEIASKLKALGFNTLVLESCQASKIKDAYCNDDKASAIKLARVYLTGLSRIVWQPDELTRERREIFFLQRNMVKETTRVRNSIRSFLNEHCIRLPRGTRLTEKSGLNKSLSLGNWSAQQKFIIEMKFNQLWEAETRRKELEKVMVREVLGDDKLRPLLRLLGIRHIIAFAIGALVGDIHRFQTPKKLSAYIGLSPRREQSGNNKKGKEKGIGHGGRRDLRSLLIQSAQCALNTKSSPLHSWGWKLLIRKCRNIATTAIARKLSVAIWHLLNGNFTPLTEASTSIKIKLGKLGTLLGKKQLTELGFNKRSEFIDYQIEKLLLST